MYLRNCSIHHVKLLNALVILLAVLTLNSCYALREVSYKHKTEREQRITERTQRKNLEDSLILDGRIQKGFTKKQVVEAYGKPYKKNLPQRIPYGYSLHFIEQWVYLDRRQYVYFIDGKFDCAIDMQDRTKRKRYSSFASKKR